LLYQYALVLPCNPLLESCQLNRFSGNARLFALDIDGTLLSRKRELSAATEEAIGYVTGRGALVTVCTGRSLSSAEPVIGDLRLNAPYVLNNGALIYDRAKNRARYLRHLTRQTAKASIQLFRRLGIYPIVYGPLPEVRYFYYDRFDSQNRSFIDYIEQNAGRAFQIDDVLTVLNQQITCVTCDDRVSRIMKLEETIRHRLPNAQVTLEYSPWDLRHCHVSIMPAGVSKGDGLRRLCRLLGIRLGDVIAVGDNLNDLEMLSVAGLGVAMGNSPPEVKKRADYVTDSVEEDGVARVIERFAV